MSKTNKININESNQYLYTYCTTQQLINNNMSKSDTKINNNKSNRSICIHVMQHNY